MFIGEYQHVIDQKGRLAMPLKFRKQLAGRAVMTRGLDSCLFVYSIAEWKSHAEKLAALSLTQSKNRAVARHMLAGAMEVEADKQGRVLVPEYLRKFAGIDKDVVVAGLYNRIEVWDADAWNKYQARTVKKVDDIAEQLGELGL